MNRYKDKIFLFLITLLLVISTFSSPASAQVSVTDAYNNTAQYMIKSAPNPNFGDEWSIIALARGDYPVPPNYYETYYRNLEQYVKSVNGNLHNRKYTEYARVIMALSAIGKDATNVGGYNLVEKLYDFDQVVWQGINGPIFALIALDSWKFELPATASTSREKLISYILSKELSEGGFALSGHVADPDITAMALQALAPYKERNDVKNTIEKGLSTLATLQNPDGSYNSWEIENAESVAQVILALTAVAIDPVEDARFNKTINHLLSFYNTKDGGFKHVKSELKSNGMATEQAAYTLVAYARLLAGKTSLYDMTDMKKTNLDKPKEQEKPTLSKPMFKDIEQHWAKNDIEKAYERNLLKGFEDGTFRPNQQLTRVQAISILVRALNIKNEKMAPYTDISNVGLDVKNEIAAAFEAGLLLKKSGKLEPKATISREELAIMLARAYSLQKNGAYVPTTLAPFKDIQHLTKEAKQSITFLNDFNIASGAYGLFNPSQTTTRAQAAKLFVNFLQVVEN